MSIEAMKQALEALERGRSQIIGALVQRDQDEAITALRQAIAEAEKQEPMAWFIQYEYRHEFLWREPTAYEKNSALEVKPLYTSPVHAIDISQERVDETAKREHEWVGLDGDIPGLGLVTEEFYNGMLCAEDILRKRNT
jgi:hypothetical protein